MTSTGETAMPSDQQLNADGKNYTTVAPNGKVGAADACGLEASGGQIKEALQKYPEQSFAQKFGLCNR